MQFADIILEGLPSASEQHAAPILPAEYAGDYKSCIPRIPLPNGRFLFYMRAERSVVDRIANDSRISPDVVGRSWTELFFGSYRFWDSVFDAEIEEPGEFGITHVRRKIGDVTDQRIIGVYPPGVFAGDEVPELAVPQFIVDRYVRMRNDVQLIRPVVSAISEELVRHLAAHPDALHRLRPRQFEQLICDILRKHGWDVELTPESRDGGYDIIGFSGVSGGIKSHWIIECKKWAPDRKVGVEVVRGLCGVKEQLKSANAMIVTTSSFTRGANELAHSRWDLSLKDYTAVTDWLRAISG